MVSASLILLGGASILAGVSLGLISRRHTAPARLITTIHVLAHALSDGYAWSLIAAVLESLAVAYVWLIVPPRFPLDMVSKGVLAAPAVVFGLICSLVWIVGFVNGVALEIFQAHPLVTVQHGAIRPLLQVYLTFSVLLAVALGIFGSGDNLLALFLIFVGGWAALPFTNSIHWFTGSLCRRRQTLFSLALAVLGTLSLICGAILLSG